jgi:hypothetical protein
MKLFSLLLIALLGFSSSKSLDCGDGKTYANIKQTEFDKRFDSYEKIKGCPEFKEGDKGLTELILKDLKLSDIAKTQVFNLNFTAKITCDGKIVDARQIGDPKMDEFTNILQILKSTQDMWTPAKKDGKPVECIYFGKVFINGTKY